MTATIELTTTECPECGILFGYTMGFDRRRRDDGQRVYCPQGHSMSYGNSKISQLEKQVAQERAAHDQTRAALRSKIADAEAKARELEKSEKKQAMLRKRVSHGVCPCCQRTFKQLAAHMANKHPDYAKAS